jgi:hypothetical protein
MKRRLWLVGMLALAAWTITYPAQARDNRMVAGPLNGLPTLQDKALRRPLAVMVENYAPDARPQTGLLPASVVFETVAEFGITRFMAVYQEQDAPVVGPIRATRIYYNHWADALHAIFAHAGGNSDALLELERLQDLVNIDEVATERGLYDTGAAYFFRSPARYAPHNLYMYPAKLRAHVAATTTWTMRTAPWTLAHKAPASLVRRPARGSIDLSFSGPDYAVRYEYDRVSNSYLRSMGGKPHVDAISGVRVAPQNVVVLLAKVTPDRSSDTLGSVVVQSEGQGAAYYFRDGRVRSGRWRKTAISTPLELLDDAGQPIRLNPGQTWIEVVPQGNPVSWKVPNAP